MDLVVARRRPSWPSPGDTVLLAPAAQSFDMFRDYPARGDAFAAAVRRLAGCRERTSRADRCPQFRAAGRPGPRAGCRRLGLLDRPLTSYYLILGITVLLLALGLVMVLSTSSAAALDSGGSPYAGSRSSCSASRSGCR